MADHAFGAPGTSTALVAKDEDRLARKGWSRGENDARRQDRSNNSGKSGREIVFQPWRREPDRWPEGLGLVGLTEKGAEDEITRRKGNVLGEIGIDAEEAHIAELRCRRGRDNRDSAFRGRNVTAPKGGGRQRPAATIELRQRPKGSPRMVTPRPARLPAVRDPLQAGAQQDVCVGAD
jgi:hypothetical protein